MHHIYRFLLVGALTLPGVRAQEETFSSNAPASSLRLSAGRTQEKRIEFLIEVAQAYEKEGDLASAADAYERVLQIDPTHRSARLLTSHIYIVTKQYNKAEALLLELIEDAPDNFTLMNNLAWVYATAEDPSIRNGEKAITLAQKALVMAPNDHHVWSTLSEAYYMSGDYEKAHRAIEQMARLATRYGRDITEKSIAEYNEQIRKCKRALDTAEAMKKEEAE